MKCGGPRKRELSPSALAGGAGPWVAGSARPSRGARRPRLQSQGSDALGELFQLKLRHVKSSTMSRTDTAGAATTVLI
jgi:hypothetical protein